MNDVRIAGYERPWNAKPDAGRLASGIPKSSLWAYKEGGENQVGCIYTAQGFEFDYVGVIFGTDLVYRPGTGWIGQKGNSHDSVVKRSGTSFTDLVKNTYRVLLTRGIKGCYVHFLDKDTATFFKSRTELVVAPDSFPKGAS
ncbi:MAG: peptidase [Verrucomicrobia bacterium]|nr:peptidase [Verrucomicrobiota bacterium]